MTAAPPSQGASTPVRQGHEARLHEETKCRLNSPVVGDALQDVSDPARGADCDWLSAVELSVVPIQLRQS